MYHLDISIRCNCCESRLEFRPFPKVKKQFYCKCEKLVFAHSMLFLNSFIDVEVVKKKSVFFGILSRKEERNWPELKDIYRSGLSVPKNLDTIELSELNFLIGMRGKTFLDLNLALTATTPPRSVYILVLVVLAIC